MARKNYKERVNMITVICIFMIVIFLLSFFMVLGSNTERKRKAGRFMAALSISAFMVLQIMERVL